VLVLWDFDGTLATRDGMWSGAVLEALDARDAAHGLTRADIRAAMHRRYPWDRWETPHPELCEGALWWAHVEAAIVDALASAGLAPADAPAVAREARERYLDTSRAWLRFDDTLPALEAVAERGWRSAILSNHVPELPLIADALGISPHVEAIFTSAATGYEKPHPQAFEVALRALGRPQRVWMVGDNPAADVEGATAAGLRAILVRSGGAGGLAHAAARILADDA
jgi:putative hydrolase of the HAD superfamily